MWQSCFKTVKFPMQHTHKKTGCEPRRDTANVRFTPRVSQILYNDFFIPPTTVWDTQSFRLYRDSSTI